MLVDPRQIVEIVSVNHPGCKIISISKIFIAVFTTSDHVGSQGESWERACIDKTKVI